MNLSPAAILYDLADRIDQLDIRELLQVARHSIVLTIDELAGSGDAETVAEIRTVLDRIDAVSTSFKQSPAATLAVSLDDRIRGRADDVRELNAEGLLCFADDALRVAVDMLANDAERSLDVLGARRPIAIRLRERGIRRPMRYEASVGVPALRT